MKRTYLHSNAKPTGAPAGISMPPAKAWSACPCMCATGDMCLTQRCDDDRLESDL